MKLILFATCLFGIAFAFDHRKADQIHNIKNDEKQRTGYSGPPMVFDPRENETSYWMEMAQNTLIQKLGRRLNKNQAKNVIFFMGDGMSIPTLAAARIYLGQQHGNPGEETVMSFEEFPHTGLAKTYCLDAQVADSACTATAYLSGVKINAFTSGVNGQVQLDDCAASMDPQTHLDPINRWFQLAGKKSGFVTTVRVTHASPSPMYGHTANRNWESDTDVVNGGADPNDCPDLAAQLIDNPAGQNLNVILGGGRRKFLPNNVADISGPNGTRSDGRQLINEWIAQKSGAGVYVTDKAGLAAVDTDNTEYLMGLFGNDHMNFHLDATVDEPSLTEMTEAAIKTLDNENGYFLFVEAGHIDYAHHWTTAVKAVDETVELHKAVLKALELTDEEDTLIIVSSDHSHTMTINGYPKRGHDIFGFASVGDDAKPFSTLSYANGFRGFEQDPITGSRYDLTNDDLSDKDYLYPAGVPSFAETHGGDDVAVFCKGPWAHLCDGVYEQNLIPHILAYAACVGDGATVCDLPTSPTTTPRPTRPTRNTRPTRHGPHCDGTSR